MQAHYLICRVVLKTRGLRIKGDDTPIMPGEFRDVDVPGGTIAENITVSYHTKNQVKVLYCIANNNS
jgi:hypothetical protein